MGPPDPAEIAAAGDLARRWEFGPKEARPPAACKCGGSRPDAAQLKRRNRARAKAARAARRAARA